MDRPGGGELIELGQVNDLYLLLAGLAELSDRGALLYVEGNSIAADVKEFLEGNVVAPTMAIERGTIWPRSAKYHLPLTSVNLTALRELSERHAEPEICDHLVVYRGEQVLLRAYDAGTSQVWASADLPPAMLTSLRRTLLLAEPER